MKHISSGYIKELYLPVGISKPASSFTSSTPGGKKKLIGRSITSRFLDKIVPGQS